MAHPAVQPSPRKLCSSPVVAELGATLAQPALSWTLKNPAVGTVFTGASRTEQVRENMKALNVVPKLTDEVMQKTDEILANKPGPLRNRRG